MAVPTKESPLAVLLEKPKAITREKTVSLIKTRVEDIVIAKDLSAIAEREKVRSVAETVIETKAKSRAKTRAKTIVETVLSAPTIVDVLSEAKIKPLTETILRTRTKSVKVPKIPSLFAPRKFPKLKDPIPKKLSKAERSVLLRKGFEVLLKRKGVFLPVGTGLTRKAALSLGIKRTKETLAATFKIVPTGRPARISKLVGAVSGLRGEFRTFKIRKGKKIFLEDEFIQRKRKRLGTIAERRAIQKARKGRVKFL